MKYFLIISAALALSNSVLVADQVNKALGGMKQAGSQNTEGAVTDEDIRVTSEKTNGSMDTVISAFTFLLGALTVMATLFGIFMGYTWWKSSKEYENEVRRAEAAASRAEVAAGKAEATIGEIKTKGDKAIEDITGELRSIIDVRHTTKTEENLRAALEEAQKAYEVVQDAKVAQKLEELRRKAIDSLKKNDTTSALRWLQESIALNQDDIRILGSLGLILLGLGRFEEALGPISTAIQKHPKYGAAYLWRIQAMLLWQKNGGPTPSKDAIEADIRMARELGYMPDYQDRSLLADFLTDEEYKELLGFGKERDMERKAEKFLAREKLSRILDTAIRKLQNEDFQEGLGLIEAYSILDNANPKVWAGWALVLAHLKRYEEALQKIVVAIDKNPTDGSLYIHRAKMKLEWHQNGGAKPPKDEIVSDIKEAAKYGYRPEKYDEEDKVTLLDFFSRDAYYKLVSDLK